MLLKMHDWDPNHKFWNPATSKANPPRNKEGTAERIEMASERTGDCAREVISFRVAVANASVGRGYIMRYTIFLLLLPLLRGTDP